MVLPLTLAAQDKTSEQTSGGIPIFSGKGSVTEAVDSKKGAVFDIGGGVKLLLPKGIPVGSSRLVTLKTAKNPPAPSQVQKGFKRHGKTLLFDGALNTADKPMVLSLQMKNPPNKRGQKFVLAMEQAGLCNDGNKKFKLKSGLCSTWETIETKYDKVGKRVLVILSYTGGLRMQFGWVPVPKTESKSE